MSDRRVGVRLSRQGLSGGRPSSCSKRGHAEVSHHSEAHVHADRLSSVGSTKLHVGCGSDVYDGWVNIDKSPSVLLARAPALRAALSRTGC